MNSTQSSFIPKSPINTKVTKRKVRKIYVLTYVVYVLFLASLIGSVGVWFYKQTLNNELLTIKSQIAEEQSRFNQGDFERVNELNMRLAEAAKLMQQQVSLNNIFSALETVTVSSVTLKGLSYSKNNLGTLELSLSASADDFNTVLFQRSILSANSILNGSRLSDVEVSTAVEDDTSVTSSKTISFVLTKDFLPVDLSVATNHNTTQIQLDNDSNLASTTLSDTSQVDSSTNN